MYIIVERVKYVDASQLVWTCRYKTTPASLSVRLVTYTCTCMQFINTCEMHVLTHVHVVQTCMSMHTYIDTDMHA